MSDMPPFLGLGLDDLPAGPRVTVLPVPYEGTVTYGGGTGDGPRALLEASAQVELYDEVLACEPYRIGIETAPVPELPADPRAAVDATRQATRAILDAGRFPVLLGGEHSISAGAAGAVLDVFPECGVIQFDAHADLRDTYEGSPHSHACVMARIRERTDRVLQIGIRSLSGKEAEQIRARNWRVGFMHRMRQGYFNMKAALDALPDQIYITFDVDALDLSLVRATGTPEPNGLTWEETFEMLETIFERKTVVGFDVVELCGGDRASAFTAARLVYRMIGLRFADALGCRWR